MFTEDRTRKGTVLALDKGKFQAVLLGSSPLATTTRLQISTGVNQSRI